MTTGSSGTTAAGPELTAAVEKIWRDVLQVAEGEDDATFFELNGESISANRLTSRIEAEFGVRIEVGDLFEEDPDAAGLARMVADRLGDPSRV
ncbi:hypothetical protein Sru01_12390 [Sphaerisporangium rufum]|uniref:Carrier domain-containing protein n=1 Tax=Sphaerisporangium rufum TaxID=1381558 RepID=A0A919UZG0_9ACTN|nr:phosphopantetheine-binding protein [Sphaerisporangium rufum]GII76257.1 hypothetical protein Sru01_12390 [Sphaerisporangium rufum]